jgi:hypothetical protein
MSVRCQIEPATDDVGRAGPDVAPPIGPMPIAFRGDGTQDVQAPKYRRTSPVALSHSIRMPATIRPDLSALSGSVIMPGDPEYADARLVWNRAYDRYPAMVVRPANDEDVSIAVRFAAENLLPLAIRGGGHSMSGLGTIDDGMVIDMSAMRAISINPATRTAVAEGGARAAEYAEAAHAHGLATPHGDTGSVGIGGLTLGGGVGFLVRKHGLAIDDVLSADLVTADGQILRAGPGENEDLFWAVRGGGGNFGVVTRFRYRLHPVGTVFGGALALPPQPRVIRDVLEIADGAPDELTIIALLMHLPPMPMVAPEHHGKLALVVLALYAGDPEMGRQIIAPMRAVAPPYGEALGPMPYPQIYDLTAEAGNPSPTVVRSSFLREVDDDLIDSLLTHMTQLPSAFSFVQLRVLGGHMARVDRGSTAFAHRDARFLALASSSAEDPADTMRRTAWVNSLHAAFESRSSGAYLNFLADDGERRLDEAYPAATMARLRDTKRRYDPSNLFRSNHNIQP